MNYSIGFLIVFSIGVPLIIAVSSLLEKYGYTDTQLLIAKIILVLILTSIPPLLTFFGRNDDGETPLERIGKPITSFGSLLGRVFSPSTSLITLLLIIIINILIWK